MTETQDEQNIQTSGEQTPEITPISMEQNIQNSNSVQINKNQIKKNEITNNWIYFSIIWIIFFFIWWRIWDSDLPSILGFFLVIIWLIKWIIGLFRKQKRSIITVIISLCFIVIVLGSIYLLYKIFNLLFWDWS